MIPILSLFGGGKNNLTILVHKFTPERSLKVISKVILHLKNNFDMYRKYIQSFTLLSLNTHNLGFFKLNSYTVVLSACATTNPQST